MNNFPAMTEEQREYLNQRLRTRIRSLEVSERKGHISDAQQDTLNIYRIALSALTADGWIKCSEQMPEDDTLCLGFDVEGIIWTAHYDCGFLTPDCGADDVVFTHWMPLPSPPEASNEQ